VTRQKSSLRPPAAGLKLDDFPTELVQEEATLYRAHDARFTSPWFFASDEAGRFNIPMPRGTCYAAEDVETAVRERLGEIIVESQAIEADLAAGMAVTGIVLDADTEVAAVNHRDAVKYGLTREIGTAWDYTVTRPWAELFASVDVDGIHYASRFTTEAVVNSWALFGEAGEAPSRCFLPESRIEGIAACESAGLRILPSTLDDSTTLIVTPPTT
jgi:RES domain-containing protein